MSDFTFWAVRYRTDDAEELVGKYIDPDQAERVRQGLEAQGYGAWIEEEQWDVAADGPVQIVEGHPSNQSLHGSWQRLIKSLAETLGELTTGQSLSLHSASEHWVQFRVLPGGLLAEAVSNLYLDEDNQLDEDQEAALEALGWLPPFDAHGIERAQNYYREFAAPVSYADIATMAVHTLADVYEVDYPQELTYIALDGNKPRGERDLSFPDLGVAVPRFDDEVGGVLTNDPLFDTQEHLVDALRQIIPDFEQWEIGEVITIRCGSVPVSIQVAGDPPTVRIWSPILANVTETVHLLRELNDINAQTRFARLFLTSDGTVIVATEFDGLPFVGKHFLSTLQHVGGLADSLDERIRVRHGGTPIGGRRQEHNGSAPVPGYL